MKRELKRVALHVLTLALLSGVLGALLADAPRFLEADQRGELALRTALLMMAQGWRLSLDIAAIAAALALVFLRAVPLPRAAAWLTAGMTLGALTGVGLSWSSEVRAWVVAYTIGGMTCGLVATCVRLWGAERATRGFPVRVGTLLAK
jgi:hypothetical protein